MPDEAQPVAAPQPERPAAASATPGKAQPDGAGTPGPAGGDTQGPAEAPAHRTPAAPAKPTPPPGTKPAPPGAKAAPSSGTKPAAPGPGSPATPASDAPAPTPPAPAAAKPPAPAPAAKPPARPAATPPAAPTRSGGSSNRVRARLARLGVQRSSPYNPVLEPLLRTVRGNDPKIESATLRQIEKAYQVAERWHRGQKRKSGDPYITHPLAVTTILAELGMDPATLMAGLLHDTVEDTEYGLDTLRKDFGDQVALLVDGVTKLDKVKFGEAAQAETVRKMVVAMAKDPRVLVIKLADRLHNMRTMRYLKREKQEKKARETLEIYAPLAHRLGMNTIKWELEDLAFAILYPKMYDEIVRLVAERAPKRDEYLAIVTDEVQADLRAARIKATVTGRPKHYYSVYQKMIVRGRDFAEIYDLVGIRVLVDTVRDCYAALGTVHARWNPVPGRFKDYIAMPKFNMYQSLHTTVIGPSGKPVELQIRTFDMHRRAEYGIAAHWKYKQEAVAGASKVRTDIPKNTGGGRGQDTVNDMAWLRQLLDWQKETEDPSEFLESLRFDLSRNEVFVFTPKGDVIALPAGATPVDFAYAVHTEVGHRTIGARVNGRLVPLESTLDNGDLVEVFTSKAAGAGPSRDWLQFVKSPRARNKIRAWFSKERRDEAIEQGKDAIARAMRKQNLPIQRILTGDSLVTLAHEMRYPDISSLYAAIGEGHVAAAGVVQKLVQALGGEDAANEDLAESSPPSHGRNKRRAKADPGVVVKGVEDVWVKLARCCTPVPGDPIIGFVTRGSGVSVHRADCVNVDSLSQQPERILDVEWAPTQSSVFLVAIQVEALDRSRLLSDVTRVLSDQHVNILSAAVQTSRDRVATSRFTFEMGDPKHLGHVLKAVRGVEGVYDVYRVTSARRP
ncbi:MULTISPECIES: bifunctional (p)ppGpp synthetase/guanosine-3',5'-bis(diphosphate) 3'-pyrophosphohydrolase [Streptomyces]|uniref:Bifunctional (P)ppGpp synthetase/guanosine-3',5'-bis(Diphosphate) 3'-pyrophosphohydrolase n=1 Tax=Streptomyces silvae TaxID=2803812 RepID=A0ABU7ZX25_9ACTN|nr:MULTISPECIES: bifunctional (p)ppGpp synthetase/guanosine-3',5'-bis(diphosphate) 3'-pyrophosphohydrolase [unclassified Streptomyces]WSS67780.1 bifunctional (p)ppGpp synthetase/guanosine-3',5'-bis(diphosphate) 3'-pyrophosphohydrolase [Streptomyces sp. NBC_01175]WSS74772.1 bifunctional (p)ppGpp synthetase/guanosine-3',5'-bis(diphosphate) 3'-pyrophosphohydrolase [Streptomyces sp. NBC_01174]MDX3429950.1 bifunctional (p)ppGpp synthetase/guanosine-3',5'-bis(diphosphate) 3'-pyrophosphohydrolase [Stre